MLMQLIKNFQTKRRMMMVLACTSVFGLSGCYEDLLDTEPTGSFGSSTGSSSSSSSTSLTGSSSFPSLRQIATGCPAACLDVDVATQSGISSSCSRACPETQAAAQCTATGSYIDSYNTNGQAGATSAQLAQLQAQYTQQATLTREFLARAGCR